MCAHTAMDCTRTSLYLYILQQVNYVFQINHPSCNKYVFQQQVCIPNKSPLNPYITGPCTTHLLCRRRSPASPAPPPPAPPAPRHNAREPPAHAGAQRPEPTKTTARGAEGVTRYNGRVTAAVDCWCSGPGVHTPANHGQPCPRPFPSVEGAAGVGVGGAGPSNDDGRRKIQKTKFSGESWLNKRHAGTTRGGGGGLGRGGRSPAWRGGCQQRVRTRGPPGSLAGAPAWHPPHTPSASPPPPRACQPPSPCPQSPPTPADTLGPCSGGRLGNRRGRGHAAAGAAV